MGPVEVSEGVTVGPPGVEVGPLGVGVGVSDAGDCVKVGEGRTVGVDGAGDPIGVGVNVGGGVPPRTVRLAAIDSSAVSTLSPLETRALHSIMV